MGDMESWTQAKLTQLTAHGSWMAPTTEFTDLKTELQSIEHLINQLLQQQSVLCSRLATFKAPPDTQRSPAPAAVVAAVPVDVPGSTSTPSWACVIKGRKKRSLLLYDPFGPGVNDVTLANFFSPLAKLHSEPVSPPPARSAAQTPVCALQCLLTFGLSIPPTGISGLQTTPSFTPAVHMASSYVAC
ncbi:hypothetical protein ABVT39_016286 [Epinephelus coioides]